MQRREDRTKPRGLADLLLPFSLIEDGIMLQIDGSLLCGWKFSGPDMESSGPEELAALSDRLNSILRLGSGWMVQCDAIRSAVPGYPDRGAFKDPVSQCIDEERRQQFRRLGAHFESSYFLTLTYLPPRAVNERMGRWMFTGTKTHSGAAEQALDKFRAVTGNFASVLGSVLRIERLGSELRDVSYDHLLRFYRRCLTGEDGPFLRPNIPVDLADVLASQDFVGGLRPKIGAQHIAVVSVDGFPKMSWPGMLSPLDALPVEFRWNTRMILMDPLQAASFLEVQRKKWTGRLRGFWTTMTGQETGPIDQDALQMVGEAESATALANANDVQFAQYSNTVVVLSEDPVKLDADSRLVMKTLRNIGLSCRVELVNAVDAWRGTLPGDGYSNVRRVLLHTLNIADMLPTTAVWAGMGTSPNSMLPAGSPPLLLAATTGATPFRLNLHVGDVGHTIVTGPSGSGKSTLLGAFAAQFLRYEGARVFAFDRGYSLWALTEGVGGDHYDVFGDDGRLAFCPLSRIDSDADLAWAAGWIEALCELNGTPTTPRHKNAIHRALLLTRNSPTRTLTEFCANIQDHDVRDTLQHFTLRGPLGDLLDADRDSFSRDDAQFICFETENLSKLDDKAVVPVMLYLFRRIERLLDGNPTLIIIDEAWAALGHPLFAARLEEWLRTLRKRNTAVVLATQQLSDIAGSTISNVVIDNCPTKILLPNAEAGVRGSVDHPGPREVYEAMGLNERGIEILRGAIPKKHYYVTSPLGRRLIDLGLGPVAMAWIGVNGAEARMRLRRIMTLHPDDWRERWLRAQGLESWADYFRFISQEVKEQETVCGIAS